MYSSVISKIEKARKYAQEPQRLTVLRFTATFAGDHDSHTISYDAGKWNCTCDFFSGYATCSHTMAVPRMLEVALSEGAGAPALD